MSLIADMLAGPRLRRELAVFKTTAGCALDIARERTQAQRERARWEEAAVTAMRERMIYRRRLTAIVQAFLDTFPMTGDQTEALDAAALVLGSGPHADPLWPKAIEAETHARVFNKIIRMPEAELNGEECTHQAARPPRGED